GAKVCNRGIDAMKFGGLTTRGRATRAALAGRLTARQPFLRNVRVESNAVRYATRPRCMQLRWGRSGYHSPQCRISSALRSQLQRKPPGSRARVDRDGRGNSWSTLRPPNELG